MRNAPKTRRRALTAIALCAVASPFARAAERVTLANGFEFDCARREPTGDPANQKVRLYFASSNNYLDVAASSIVRVETVPEPPPPVAEIAAPPAAPAASEPTLAELHELLSRAGSTHHIDAELLASVVHAESNGRTHAVSRAGARGLMQLMPATAAGLGVKDAFVAAENVEGGSKYLDAMLTRYHDNLALALAAYNAGPGAVDRFHGVPPFRETRAYVSRIIREFNRRKTTLLAASLDFKAK